MSSSTPLFTGLYNTTAAHRARTTSTPLPPGFLGSTDGLVVLTLLIIILLLLVITPILAIILGKRFCWIKVHDPERGKWSTDTLEKETDNKENEKCTQTDVLGIEFDEFYKRRRPIDMSQYVGKRLSEVEEPFPRWFRINPNEANDPWTLRHAGKETNYLRKEW